MGKAKILIVEDEKDLLKLLQYNFQRQGYRIFTARDAESGLKLARRRGPDLILLDIMLPKMDGLELCRILRQETQSPIIFLTAKKSELDRILGFKLGGDDYVVKPFSVRELLARAEAVLRRAETRPTREKTGLRRVGSLVIDPERHEVRIHGKAKLLPPKEFGLLRHLIKADGKVLSREDLLQHIWGHAPGSEIDTRTVDQHIARLRRRLASERGRILTVTNSGYRLKTD